MTAEKALTKVSQKISDIICDLKKDCKSIKWIKERTPRNSKEGIQQIIDLNTILIEKMTNEKTLYWVLQIIDDIAKEIKKEEENK